jgi:lipoate-protein ligase A
MNAQPWRVLFTGKQRGAFNMAVDAAILKAVEERRSPPTLRIYGWEPFCVSLGYFQKVDQELDPVALEERGWDFVLRPTGGRAVLHAEEITYSLIARRDEADWCGTLKDSFDRISRAWAVALGDFNLDLSKGRPVGATASTSRSELAHGERKVVGSAQRRTRDAFLQHGSIPLTSQHERLMEVLPLSEEEKRDYLDALRAHAISLGEIGSRPLENIETWSQKLAISLLEALKVPGEIGELTRAEALMAQELEKDHHARQEGFLKHAQIASNTPAKS